MAICNEEGCAVFTIKKPRVNRRLQCELCRETDKQQNFIAKRKEANREKRVAPKSKCPMIALDDAKRTEWVAILHCNIKINKHKLDCSIKRMALLKCEILATKKMLKHMKKAMKKMANNKVTQSSLEEIICLLLLELETEGKHTKGKKITRQNAKHIVETRAMHAKSWVRVQRGRNTAISYIPVELGLAFNDYLRCLVANCQAREDGVLVQLCPSAFAKLKSAQHITDDQCP